MASNALYVLAALILLLAAQPDEAPFRIGLKAAFVGLTLCSRANYLLLAPVVLICPFTTARTLALASR